LATSDADIVPIRVGQGAEVTLEGLAPVTFPATASEIGARTNDATGTFRVDLALPPQPGLRSGMIGTARPNIEYKQAQEAAAVSIPVAAVFGARAD
jgi:hypothetical protein